MTTSLAPTVDLDRAFIKFNIIITSIDSDNTKIMVYLAKYIVPNAHSRDRMLHSDVTMKM